MLGWLIGERGMISAERTHSACFFRAKNEQNQSAKRVLCAIC